MNVLDVLETPVGHLLLQRRQVEAMRAQIIPDLHLRLPAIRVRDLHMQSDGVGGAGFKQQEVRAPAQGGQAEVAI